MVAVHYRRRMPRRPDTPDGLGFGFSLHCRGELLRIPDHSVELRVLRSLRARGNRRISHRRGSRLADHGACARVDVDHHCGARLRPHRLAGGCARHPHLSAVVGTSCCISSCPRGRWRPGSSGPADALPTGVWCRARYCTRWCGACSRCGAAPSSAGTRTTFSIRVRCREWRRWWQVALSPSESSPAWRSSLWPSAGLTPPIRGHRCCGPLCGRPLRHGPDERIQGLVCSTPSLGVAEGGELCCFRAADEPDQDGLAGRWVQVDPVANGNVTIDQVP